MKTKFLWKFKQIVSLALDNIIKVSRRLALEFTIFRGMGSDAVDHFHENFMTEGGGGLNFSFFVSFHLNHKSIPKNSQSKNSPKAINNLQIKRNLFFTLTHKKNFDLPREDKTFVNKWKAKMIFLNYQKLARDHKMFFKEFLSSTRNFSNKYLLSSLVILGYLI